LKTERNKDLLITIKMNLSYILKKWLKMVQK